MSDIEDEMEVDGRGRDDVMQDAMVFSSRTNDKGKRSAANLPVELEDSLPWVEKYRPNTLADVSGHQDIIRTINKFLDKNQLPHLLLYGPPGTGKTSTVLALARHIYGVKNMRQMVLELNASDDRGIDVVREQIRTFSSTKQIFSAFTTAKEQSSLATFKLIILDEADAMTATAQMALRRIMEKYTPNTRFAIIANYTHKLSPALLSRCTRFRFSPLQEPAIRSLVDKVISEEKVNIAPDAVDALVKLSKGDMRRALNVLQACHASTMTIPGLSYDVDEQPAHSNGSKPEPEIITIDTIYDCIAAPLPSSITTIRDTLLTSSDVKSIITSLKTLKNQFGLALADMITSLSEELMLLEVPAQTRATWLEGLAEIEMRVSSGGNEDVQLGGMVGVVRRGVELMDKGKQAT